MEEGRIWKGCAKASGNYIDVNWVEATITSSPSVYLGNLSIRLDINYSSGRKISPLLVMALAAFQSV